MSSEESNKTSRQILSQDSPSDDECYRAILDAAEHGWDDLLDRADQPANPFAEELWLMEKKKAQQQERNTRHSVDKGEEFIKSGMTLITDTASDKYLKSNRQGTQEE